MPAINAVIFDLGRVLVDLDFTRGLLGRLATTVGEIEAIIRELYADRIIIDHMTGRSRPEEFHAACCRRLGLELGFADFVAAWCDMFTVKPDMRQLFEEVAARVPVGICSDTDPLHWRFLRECMPHLAAVARPTLSFEVGVCKPDAEIFRRAAAQVGCPPGQCFFTDDLVGNVDGARAIGMTAEVFTGAPALRRRLVELGVLPDEEPADER